MLAHAPIGEKLEMVRKTADPATRRQIKRQGRALAGKFALAFFGLALFAAMGYLLGNFFVGLHLHWPGYFPH
jgi:hypothetical protein